MNIGNDYKITSDTLNIILSKKRVKITGKVVWTEIAYFATIKEALIELVNCGVRETHLEDLKTVSKKQDEILELIKGISGKQILQNS